MLKMVNWTIFENKEEDDKNVLNLVGKIQDAIKTEQKIPEVPVGTFGKLKIDSTVKNIGGGIENFQDRNFEYAEKVPGTKFEEAFKKSQLSGELHSKEKMPERSCRAAIC